MTFDSIAIAKAMRAAYGRHIKDTVVPWEQSKPDVRKAWIACAEAAVEEMLDQLSAMTPRSSG